MQVIIKKASLMGAFFIALLVCGSAVNLAWSHSCGKAQVNQYAEVAYVYDGDSVRLTDGRQVRFIGMDTPEISRKEGSQSEPFAEKARRTLIKLLGKDRQIGLAFDKEKKDRYGRYLAHGYTADGMNISAYMLKQGMAKTMVIPPNTRYAECYYVNEKKAREHVAGIWGLVDYKVVPVKQLKNKALDYQIVEGEVSDVYETKRAIKIVLERKLTVTIKKADLAYFKALSLDSLHGKRLHVRGAVFRTKKGLIMPIRHKSAMELAF